MRKTVQDRAVFHVWKCPNGCGDEITVDPSFYAASGTPICEACADDMDYLRTEVDDGVVETPVEKRDRKVRCMRAQAEYIRGILGSRVAEVVEAVADSLEAAKI